MSVPRHLLLGLALAIIAAAATPARAEVDEAAAKRIPWSGYWFPIAKGELLEPLRKYDTLTGSSAHRWELSRNPPGAHVPEWHGYCHGWAAASLVEQEPAQQVAASAGGASIVLGIGDQKGLYAASHSGDAANWFGDRYGDGQGSEDPTDLQPDMLWQLLKLFIKDQGVPLIMDLDPGPEVWNYPVYAYRIEYQAHPNGNGWHMAQLSLWAADDAVPPDFVGLVPHFQTYTFQFMARGRAVVAGSASWVGQSVQDHPDFAWYPYVVRSENPGLQHAVVRQLIQGGAPSGPPMTPQFPGPGGIAGTPSGHAGASGSHAGASGAAGASGTAAGGIPYIPGFSSSYGKPRLGASAHNPIPGGIPTGPPSGHLPTPNIPAAPGIASSPPNFIPPSGQPRPSAPQSAGPQPNILPQTPQAVPPNVTPPAVAQPAPLPEPIPLSPVQIVAAVANRTSNFDLDVRASEFGKTQYAIGERLQLAGNCGQAGYLYLLHINPLGELELLFPRSAREDNRVTANAAFQFPPAGDYEVSGPLGNHLVKAIVTRQPLILTGLSHELPQDPNARTWQPRALRLCPTQTNMIKSLLSDYVQGKSLNSRDLAGDFSRALPEFAQDELSYYVGPVK